MASGGVEFLDDNPDSDHVKKRSSIQEIQAPAEQRPLRNGDIIACTRTWKYETYIVEVGDLGEIVNETPDEEGEVVVRWKAQNKQGYIKPSALEHFQDGTVQAGAQSPGRQLTGGSVTAQPQDTGSPRPGASTQLPPELLAENQNALGGFGQRTGGSALNTGGFGSGVSSGGRIRGIGFGHFTSSGPIAKGRAQGKSLAEKAAMRQATVRRQQSLAYVDDTPDLFPDDDDEPQAPNQSQQPHTSNPDIQHTETVPSAMAPQAPPMSFPPSSGPPMESNPDASEQHEPKTLEFEPGRIGVRYMGNIITKVTKDTQAARLGVRFGWQILRVNNNALPTNMNSQNAQKCVDVFLAQQKAEKKPYTITFSPTETVILVVGAGCDVVNGCYEEHGMHHGKPRYKKCGGPNPDAPIFIWWDKHSYWNMVNQLDFIKYKQNGGSKKSCYYGIQSDESTPPTEGWMRSHLGKNPLPVLVTAEMDR